MLILAGIAAFIGIIVIQVYWLRKAVEEEQRKFSQNIQVSLLEVANGINRYYGYTTPHANPVQKMSDDYYLVNMRNDFEAKVLELLLVNTFRSKGLNTSFEYAIYDCETDDMLYGSYVQMDKQEVAAPSTYFPKVSNLVYYFAVRIPGQQGFVYRSLRGWVMVCVVMVVILIIYGYALYVIYQQERYASLQKDFINNMTHEFKTPLSSILIAAENLSRNPGVQADEKLQQYTHLILDQGKKLDEHLVTLLNLARSDRHPLQLKPEETELPVLAETAVRLIRLKYPQAVILVENRLQQPIVKADPFHLSNVLYNFLDNAVKYSEGTAEVKLELLEASGHPVVRVQDKGTGIAPEHLKHIFDRFYRAPEHSNMAAAGFGLGLYYVKKIADLHGWKVNATSKPGAGTTFTLMLR